MIGFFFSAVVATTPPLTVRVDGPGMLRFELDGRAAYAKSASLVVEGGEVRFHGHSLLPSISAPDGVSSLSTTLEGEIFASIGGRKVDLGRLVLAVFASESSLKPQGDLLIAETRPSLMEPGDGTAGVIRQDSASTPASNAVPPIKAIVATPATTKPQAIASYHARPTKATSMAPGKAKLTFKILSELPSDKITLGDIADIDAEASLAAELRDVSLGISPAFGVYRALDKATIISGLRQQGFDLGDLEIVWPTRVRVHRQSQLISGQKFLDAAIASALAKAPKANFTVDQAPLDLAAPVGDAEISVERCELSKDGATVRLNIAISGEKFATRTLILHAEGGLAAIPIGAPVKIVLKCGGAIVEIEGKTKTSALPGQSITVVTETGSIHTGIAVSADRVEVNL